MSHPLPWQGVGRACALLLLLLPALAGGCSGQGTISGRVTVQGKPLPLGTISFHAEGGRHDVFNALVRDGKYSIDGVRTGLARVTVVAAPPPPEGAPDAAPRSRSGPAVLRRYADPEQSGLSHPVVSGPQEYSVDLGS
jgi:hypothetical protein